MMFLFHSSLAFSFMALAAGTSLVVWALQKKGNGIVLAKTVGVIIFLLSLLSIVCILYSGTKYWVEGKEMPMNREMLDQMGILKEQHAPQ